MGILPARFVWAPQLPGDVNPRTTKKTWAVVIEDANSGAVHLDIVQDYSTQAVLMTYAALELLVVGLVSFAWILVVSLRQQVES